MSKDWERERWARLTRSARIYIRLMYRTYRMYDTPQQARWVATSLTNAAMFNAWPYREESQ